MSNANTASTKWAQRAGNASGDYKDGVMNTTKDQSAAAIAAKSIYAAGVQQAITKGSYEKGLAKSGKAGWQKGVEEKGAANYGTGVMSSGALSKYATNSGKFDSARNAAASLPRGAKGSAGNLARVTAVANSLHALKVSA